MPQITCVILGDAGVGKSTFISRLATGEWNKDYVPTLSQTMTNITFNTMECGFVRFQVYEKSNMNNPQTAIILYNADKPDSNVNIGAYQSQVGNIPHVICGITRKKPDDVPHKINAKYNHHLEYPFEVLLQRLYSAVTIINMPAVAPPVAL